MALVVKSLVANAGNIRDSGSIPGSGRSLGGGHSNPLQCSCLGPMDREAWKAIFHWGVESMFPLLHYGEASDHSRSGVTWLLKLYKGIQLLPSFLVMLTLGTCPHDGGRPSSSKEVLLTAPSEVVTDSHSNHQTWRAVSVWMSGVLAMELPQLRSWCGEEVSLTYPSRIPNWPTEPESTVIAALYHSVSFHAAMVAQQLAWRKRSGNNESLYPILLRSKIRLGGSFTSFWKWVLSVKCPKVFWDGK